MSKFNRFSIFTNYTLAIRALTRVDNDSELLPRDLQHMMPVSHEGFLLEFYHAYGSATLVAHQFAQHIHQQMVWEYEFSDWIVNGVVVTILIYNIIWSSKKKN